MELKINGLHISTGKVIDPYQGFIGLNDKGQVSGGYDCYYTTQKEVDENGGEEVGLVPDLTNEEAIELADYMIELWTKFRKGKIKNE